MRSRTPVPLRRALETQARLFFHAPRGTRRCWITLGQVKALEVVPRNLGAQGKVLFYIHGGGFTFGSPRTHSAMVAQLAYRLGVRAVLPQYRLAPEAPYPAAPDDVYAAWRGLIETGVNPSNIVVGGDSAGGALAFGLVAHLIKRGEATPGAVFGFSPLTDLTHSGDSFRQNAEADVMLPAEWAKDLAEMFLQGQAGDDPRISPLQGDFRGGPPAWVTVGDTEILRDDGRRMVAHYTAQGGNATLVERHDLPHVWPIFHNILPEARETLDQLATWIRQQPGWASES
ncbi:MAG: alpha/beta hydrolase [Sulfitobacter sp.]